MKIKSEHYEYMRDKLGSVMQHLPAIQAAAQADKRVKDLEKRVRWDLSFRAGLTGWICANVYSYANDAHIDTALKNIIADFKKREAHA